MPGNPKLKQTPFYKHHLRSGGRMVPFAGWEMPIQFSSVIEEHLHVRKAVGVFDVSHMGEIEVTGKDALPFLQSVLTNDIQRMDDGSILYTLMCMEDGGVVDDLLAHRFAEDHYFLCVNASNSDKDFEWMNKASKSYNVQLTNTSLETVQLAVQGPEAEALLQPLCDPALEDIDYYRFKTGNVASAQSVVARTGYTGEDGFELYFNAKDADTVYDALLETGKEFGLKPIGLGARDTLRMEMGYALYGHEIDETANPLERGLGWIVKLNKGPFIGRDALQQSKDTGIGKKLVGLKLLGRGVPRQHYRVFQGDHPVGALTSGTFSPSLQTGIGLAVVDAECSAVGERLDIEIRQQKTPAEVVALPFQPNRTRKQSKTTKP